MLVGDLAYDLFQQVFERDDPFQAAVLVDYEPEVHLCFLHLPQNVFEPGSVDHVQRRLQHIFELESFRVEKIRHHVFAVDEADHVVKRLSIHRQTRITMLVKSFRDLFEIASTRNRSHFGARHHRLAHNGVRKLEHTMYQAALFRSQVSTLARNIDESTQLFFRVGRSVFGTRIDSDELNRAHACPVEGADWPTKNAIKELHGQRHSDSDSFRCREANQLGRLLTKHDVQRGDDRESNGEGNAVSPRI